MCLDDQVLSTYIDGELAEPWKTQVEAHLSHCANCKTRYNQLLELKKDIADARLREEEFTVQRERVWQYLEKKCVTVAKDRFAEKRFTFKAPVLVAAAAAFVLFFSGGIYLALNSGGNTMNEIPISTAEQEVDTPQTIIPVVATDSAPAAQSLQDLTIEEILQLLDERGFEVDLRLKNVEPLTVSMPVVLDNGEIVEAELYYDDSGSPMPVDTSLLGEDGKPNFTLLNEVPPQSEDDAVEDAAEVEEEEISTIEPVGDSEAEDPGSE